MIKAILNGANVTIKNSEGKDLQKINLVKNPSVKPLLVALSSEGIISLEDNNQTTGNTLTDARERAGLSTEQLADIVGITRQGMHKIESKKTMPRLDIAIKLADILDIDIKELL